MINLILRKARGAALLLALLFLSINISYAKESSNNGDLGKVYNWLGSQQDSNRRFFFFTNGLLPSYESGNDCFTYDEALSCIAFLTKGDFRKAKRVLDFYETTYNGQLKKYGKFIGFSDAYRRDGGWGETWAAGPNAWILIAINTYAFRTGDNRYAVMADALSEWLLSLQSLEGGVIGGYYGNREPMTWISTEHNFDCYAAFRDRGILTGNKKYLEVAKDIKFWLLKDAWNSKENRFNMGRDNPNYATDLSSWAVLSLGKEYAGTLDFAFEKSLNKRLYKVNNVEIEGFDFGSTYEKSPYPDKDAVWLEGTAQMVLAFDRSGMVKEKERFLTELDKALTSSTRFKNAAGLPYATNEGTPAYGSWLMQDSPLCISSTSWYIFAKKSYNPFSMDQKGEAANKLVEDLAYMPSFQFVPVVDDFEYSDIKFETAYPKNLLMSGQLRFSRRLSGVSRNSDGKHSMEVIAETSPDTTKGWGIIKRVFMCPQDWGKFTKLNLSLMSSSSDLWLKVIIRDKEGEPFESKPMFFYDGNWMDVSLDLQNDFKRGQEMPDYGNKSLDREGIREMAFEIRTDKPLPKSSLFIDDIYLQ